LVFVLHNKTDEWARPEFVLILDLDFFSSFLLFIAFLKGSSV
jgi:hypothetical protein